MADLIFKRFIKYILCLSFLFIFIFFTSCNDFSQKSDYLQYQKHAFDATVTAEYPNMCFSASISCGEWSSEDYTVSSFGTQDLSADRAEKGRILRDVALTFTEPKTLSSITVTRICGELSCSLDGILYKKEAVSGFLDFTRLFQIEGEVTDIITREDTNILKVKRVENNSIWEYEVEIEILSGLPVQIKEKGPTGQTLTVKIHSFRTK